LFVVALEMFAAPITPKILPIQLVQNHVVVSRHHDFNGVRLFSHPLHKIFDFFVRTKIGEITGVHQHVRHRQSIQVTVSVVSVRQAHKCHFVLFVGGVADYSNAGLFDNVTVIGCFRATTCTQLPTSVCSVFVQSSSCTG
jgi:hypothetical protein